MNGNTVVARRAGRRWPWQPGWWWSATTVVDPGLGEVRRTVTGHAWTEAGADGCARRALARLREENTHIRPRR